MDDYKERINQIISNSLNVHYSYIKPTSSFADLGADSLDELDVIMALEKEFDIKISEDNVNIINTVSDLYKFIWENSLSDDDGYGDNTVFYNN